MKGFGAWQGKRGCGRGHVKQARQNKRAAWIASVSASQPTTSLPARPPPCTPCASCYLSPPTKPRRSSLCPQAAILDLQEEEWAATCEGGEQEGGQEGAGHSSASSSYQPLAPCSAGLLGEGAGGWLQAQLEELALDEPPQQVST